MQFLADYGLFAFKAITIVLALLFLVGGIIALLNRGRSQTKEHFEIKSLNEKYRDMAEGIQEVILPKDEFKQLLKEQKKSDKIRQKEKDRKRIFVLCFEGDIKASAVAPLREEITAIISVATPKDEVLVCIESGGGMVHAYGLATSQLQRIREKNIPLTVCVDKIAASGGYLMACVANKILAAPFSIIGSIGVLAQLPNFYRLLKKHDIDYEQITAGNYKRTLSLFGQNTASGRKKMEEDVEAIHTLFKKQILTYRPNIDIERVATGEHWLAAQAIDLNLVDEISTSDDYLLKASEMFDLYQVTYVIKKPWTERLAVGMQMFINKFLWSWHEGAERNQLQLK